MKTLSIFIALSYVVLLSACQTLAFQNDTYVQESEEDELPDTGQSPNRYNMAYLIRGLLGRPGYTIVSFSEDSFLETPWFAVRAIVLQVRKSSAKTRIVLPERGILTSTMGDYPYVIIGEEYASSGVRFRLAVGVHTGDYAPFMAQHLVDDFRADGWTPSKSAVRSAGSE